jgi:hypothetical protein
VATRRFSAAQRTEILAAVVGKPTGVIFAFGGAEFDLVGISTAQITIVLDLLQRFPQLAGKMRDRGGDDGDALALIGTEGTKLLELARDLLRSSMFYGEPNPPADDLEVFDAWFAAAPPLQLLRELGSKIVAAAGIGQTQRDPSKAPTISGTSEPSTSIPSMQPA